MRGSAPTVFCRRACFALVLSTAAARAESLVVATYNIENYGPADRMTDAGYRQAYPKPEAEKRALRQVILGIGADILFLQEMGPAPYLVELQQDLRRAGLDYPYRFLLEAADADRHVAVLSRRPFTRVRPHVDIYFSYFGVTEKVKRGLLEIAVATDSGELTLFGVHLKSQFTDRADDPLSEVRRAAEATAVRDRVLSEFPHPERARFILLGDCNDGRKSRALLHLQQRGHFEVAVPLPAADTRGDVWTHNYHKEETYSRLDYILVSSALRPDVAGNVARIYDQAGVNDASDHRPVYITLILNAPPPAARGLSAPSH